MPDALFESGLTTLTRVSQGKVRDIYAVGEDYLLIVTTDRISAFDVILPDPIPGKGEVLTELTNFWFGRTPDIIANHLVDLRLDEVITDPVERGTVESRATVVRRLRPLPIEAVVRTHAHGLSYTHWHPHIHTHIGTHIGTHVDTHIGTHIDTQTLSVDNLRYYGVRYFFSNMTFFDYNIP